MTENARRYANYQNLPINEVGDLLAWLERPPTKLVVVDAPDALDAFRPSLVERFGHGSSSRSRCPTSSSWPARASRREAGSAFVAEHLGFPAARTVAFGDGENDLELLDWAGYAVCVENGHELLKGRADWICPA